MSDAPGDCPECRVRDRYPGGYWCFRCWFRMSVRRETAYGYTNQQARLRVRGIARKNTEEVAR